jgi:hypothetical protein
LNVSKASHSSKSTAGMFFFLILLSPSCNLWCWYTVNINWLDIHTTFQAVLLLQGPTPCLFRWFSGISSHPAVFFSHNKPVNSTFSHNNPAKRTDSIPDGVYKVLLLWVWLMDYEWMPCNGIAFLTSDSIQQWSTTKDAPKNGLKFTINYMSSRITVFTGWISFFNKIHDAYRIPIHIILQLLGLLPHSQLNESRSLAFYDHPKGLS